QDDRRLVGRYAGDDDRASDRDRQAGQGNREQGEGQMATYERRARQCVVDETEARVTDARRTAPALAQDIDQDEQGHEPEQQQEARPEELHQARPPDQDRRVTSFMAAGRTRPWK